MGEVIQLQGDQRKDVQEFLTDKKEGLELDAKTIKACLEYSVLSYGANPILGPRFLKSSTLAPLAIGYRSLEGSPRTTIYIPTASCPNRLQHDR